MPLLQVSCHMADKDDSTVPWYGLPKEDEQDPIGTLWTALRASRTPTAPQRPHLHRHCTARRAHAAPRALWTVLTGRSFLGSALRICTVLIGRSFLGSALRICYRTFLLRIYTKDLRTVLTGCSFLGSALRICTWPCQCTCIDMDTSVDMDMPTCSCAAYRDVRELVAPHKVEL